MSGSSPLARTRVNGNGEVRLAGHPGRARALVRFIEYIQSREQVWICRREDIARHWMSHFPPG